MRSHILGRNGEGFACGFLSANGYTILETNYRASCGEIDIVAKDGDMLCFVEVKTRSGLQNNPFEAVGPRKQRVLALVARIYLAERYGTDEVTCRFDVLAVYEAREGVLSGDLIKDAFYLQ